MAKDKRDKKKRPKLPDPPSLGAGTAPPDPTAKLPGPPDPTAKLPGPPAITPNDSEDDESTPATPLSSEAIASHSGLLSEIKGMGFTEGLEKLDPSEIKKPPKRIGTQEIDYQATLQKADPAELEKRDPSARTRYLKLSEEYERAAEELETKELIANAAAAYSCAALCVYLAEDAKTAVRFLTSYAKGVSLIAKHATFQAAKQVLKGTLLKDKILLVEAVELLRRSGLFSREDKDLFEAAFRKAIKELGG
ncbi:MAG: hypothetical protein ACE5OZ_16265 [Candidatus Heimdallarchaeota archaeon]